VPADRLRTPTPPARAARSPTRCEVARKVPPRWGRLPNNGPAMNRRSPRGEGGQPPNPTRPPPRHRATRSPARRRGDPHGAARPEASASFRHRSSRPIAHAARQIHASLSEYRLAARHCRQTAAVDLMPHHRVATMPLFEQLTPLPESVSAEDVLAAPLRKAMPPLSRVPHRQRSIFEALASTRFERKLREVSGPVFGHQDKGMTPFWR
jgi:hypothetical protein